MDVEAGRLRSDRLRVATPTPSTPDAVLASIARLVRRLARSSGLGDATPVGIGLPGVAIDGVLKTAANIDPAWIDFPVVDRLTRVLKRPVFIINDADAAGIAEMRFGVGKDQPGVVIFLTLGTGVGSGTFNDGMLVPNTELGQMEIRGRAAERRSAAAARIKRGLSWKAWAADLDEHLDRIHQLMWPNLIILGGGVSKSADKFVPRLTVRTTVVPALLRNDAGIIGAAIIAAEGPVAHPAETSSVRLGEPLADPAEPRVKAPAKAAAAAKAAAPGKAAPGKADGKSAPDTSPAASSTIETADLDAATPTPDGADLS